MIEVGEMLKIVQFQSPSHGQEHLLLEQIAKAPSNLVISVPMLCLCFNRSLSFLYWCPWTGSCTPGGGLTKTGVQNLCSLYLPQPTGISSFQAAGNVLY